MPAAFLLGGLMCLAVAILLIRRAYPLPHPPGRCPACGYDLAGLAENDSCPECGDPPASRTRARSLDRGLSSILQIPGILLAGGFAFPFVTGFVASEDLSWGVACVLFSLVPHITLLIIVGSLSARLSPRAAATLTACGLLGSTPPLMLASGAFAPTPHHANAFAGVAFFFASAMALFPMVFGLLVGAIVIQVRWCKQWPAPSSPRAPA